MCGNPKLGQSHWAKDVPKQGKSTDHDPKSNQFWRWSGYISMPNFRPFLPCVLLRMHKIPNLTCFTKVFGLCEFQQVTLKTWYVVAQGECFKFHEIWVKTQTDRLIWSVYSAPCHNLNDPLILTHWGRDKMADIIQTTFSNAFSWMKMCEFDWNFTEVCS